MNVFKKRCAGCAKIVEVGKLCPGCLERERLRAGREEKRRDLSLDMERQDARLSPRMWGPRIPIEQCAHWLYMDPRGAYCPGCGYSRQELIALGHARTVRLS